MGIYKYRCQIHYYYVLMLFSHRKIVRMHLYVQKTHKKKSQGMSGGCQPEIPGSEHFLISPFFCEIDGFS